MKASSSLVLLSAALAAAHFGLEYPSWRFDTLSDESDSRGYSQWTYPCAGVPVGDNRTDWPLTGGSLKLDLHHPWTYVFVNLGFSANATNFNVSLTPEFLNATGSGLLCIPKLEIPAGVTVRDGDLGSIQVITLGEKGQSLYNCADIRFSESASELSGNDCASNGVTYYAVEQQLNSTNSTNGGDDHSNDDHSGDSSDDEPGAATGLVASVTTVSLVMGLAAVFSAGLVL